MVFTLWSLYDRGVKIIWAQDYAGVDTLRGRGYLNRKTTLFTNPPLLAHCQKRGNTSHTNSLQRRSPPSVTGKSIVPTPAKMRTDRSGRAKWRERFLLDCRERHHFDVLPAPVGDPGATK